MSEKLRRTKMNSSFSHHQDIAVQLLAAAAERAKVIGTPASRNDLHDAVDAARAVGVGWTRIGDTLGIASGNAYQRYRKSPVTSEQCDAGGPDGRG